MKKLTLVMLFLLVGIGMVIAQTRKVTGIVISAEDNEPIIGASVLISGGGQPLRVQSRILTVNLN